MIKSQASLPRERSGVWIQMTHSPRISYIWFCLISAFQWNAGVPSDLGNSDCFRCNTEGMSKTGTASTDPGRPNGPLGESGTESCPQWQRDSFICDGHANHHRRKEAAATPLLIWAAKCPALEDPGPDYRE